MARSSIQALSLLLVILLLAGCDDTGTGTEDTFVIGTDVDPVEVEFSFAEFNASDVTDGTIEITSTNTDNLRDQIREEIGADRSDVVSARVRSVQLERLTSDFSVRPKVFGYLGSARVYYGDSTNAKAIAERRPISADAEVTLDLVDSDITSIVQSGPRALTLELQVDDPSLISDTGDEVEITVSYRIEVAE